MTRYEAELELRKSFGINTFYDEQWNAISRLLRGERILMIQKTGYGKSLCYQYPATQFSGLTIIFSPLIALMRDQVKGLNKNGIKAAAINSNQSHEENSINIERAINGDLCMLYIAPERLGNQSWIDAVREMTNQISMVVIDEAHCISVWGHEFRPDYRRIINLVSSLPNNMPILATTATATPKSQDDILQQMGAQVSLIRGNLIRHNFKLRVSVVKSEDEKLMWLAQNIPNMEGNGIVYTGTRVNTEIYSKFLEHVGISAIGYNGGFDTEKRIEIEKGLMENRWKVVVSTNALGMGMDKPDIRFIIHQQVPQSSIHYYQEIGRAGRDGKDTNIVLLFNSTIDETGIEQDLKLPRSFIENARPKIEDYNKVINAIRIEPLSQNEIMRKTNLRQTPLRVIKADLIDQKIANELVEGKRKLLEYRYDAPNINYESFMEVKKERLRELEHMRSYIYTNGSRMNFLCEYLGDETNRHLTNCDNTGLSQLRYEPSNKIKNILESFWDNFFPIIPNAPKTSKVVESVKYEISSPFWTEYTLMMDNKIIGKENNPQNFLNNIQDNHKPHVEILIERHISKKTRVTDVVVTSYYSYPKVGNAIRECKYRNGGDFPSFLINRMTLAYTKYFESLNLDLILFVPPTESGRLVERLCRSVGHNLGIPTYDNIKKIRNTEPQKKFENSVLKKDNVRDAFGLINSTLIKRKRVLLIDDVIDSGATIKEVSKLIHDAGAEIVAPLVLAKTVGGDSL